jgi:hypothetical protein
MTWGEISGEGARLARLRWRLGIACFVIPKMIAARRRNPHARRVRSPLAIEPHVVSH